jgi:NhaP-type Na+/H+ or K+/H+ antiporter
MGYSSGERDQNFVSMSGMRGVIPQFIHTSSRHGMHLCLPNSHLILVSAVVYVVCGIYFTTLLCINEKYFYI